MYTRFAAHLAELAGVADPPPSAFTADAVASYLDALEALGRSKATVRKERAALNRLARHLLLIGAIEQRVALEILDVEASTTTGRPRQRPALDQVAWQRVKDHAAARVLELSAAGRASAPTATRDLAIVVCLGELGLRSEELRTLRIDAITGLRARSATPWLHVVGKGSRERELPLPLEVQRALLAWLDARPPESAWNPLLFPRLGRQRHDGAFPDAEQRRDVGGATIAASALSSTALINIVAPIMRDAGVPAEHCHPHVLRHTFATLYLQRRADDSGALSKLQELPWARLDRDDPWLRAPHPRRARAQHARRRAQRPRRRRCGAGASQRAARRVTLRGLGGLRGVFRVVFRARGVDENVVYH